MVTEVQLKFVMRTFATSVVPLRYTIFEMFASVPFHAVLTPPPPLAHAAFLQTVIHHPLETPLYPLAVTRYLPAVVG